MINKNKIDIRPLLIIREIKIKNHSDKKKRKKK